MAKLGYLSWLCTSLAVDAAAILKGRDVTGYAPTPVPCPAQSLTRSARYYGDISAEEQCYYNSRQPIAEGALYSWLDKVEQDANISFNLCNEDLPVLGFTISGGGDRSALTGAGIIQAWDSRETIQTSMSGLYQALTYQTSLSGGNELIGAFERFNWPTVTELLDELWYSTLQRPILYPGGDKASSQPIYQQIKLEIEQKYAAGFNVSIVDVIGRLYSYTYLGPPDGSLAFKMSDITNQSNFVAHNVPFPIHMTVNEAPYGLACSNKNKNNSQFEMTPYEFGSWDPGVASFSQMKYLGSMPGSKNLSCVVGFDNLGFLLATSGDASANECDTPAEIRELENITNYQFAITQETFRSQIPNPFYQKANAPAVKDYDYLQMGDGGGTNMSVAVWPLIHRPFVDIIFVSDNSNGTNNYTNGDQLYNTYTQSRLDGIATMPEIPPPETFLKMGYNKRNVFFGCNDPGLQTIVYLPLVDYTYNAGAVDTSLEIVHPNAEVNAIVNNGKLVGTANGDSDWAVCVACLIVKQSKSDLPSQCEACFSKYCVN